MVDKNLIKAIRYQTLYHEHCLREILRSSNHMKAIGRVATGRIKGKGVPEQTQQIFQDIGAKAKPVFDLTLKAWTAERKRTEKELIKLAQQLPCWPWVRDQVRGVGPKSLAQIVGAAAHYDGSGLERFPNPSALWKRMGLAVIDGERQRQIAGTNAERKAIAIQHGYSPKRRAIMFVISENMMKMGGPYKALYDERKELELAKLPADKKGRRGWAHKRALRYMAKRMLRHLWCVWNGLPLEQEKAA